jgi:putative transcriptional regulator
MIVVNLDVMLAKRKMTLSELADEVGITLSNMSILKTGKVRAVRISTLDTICRVLDCNVGDILDYQPDESVRKQL